MDEFGYLVKEAEVRFFDELTKEAAGPISAKAVGELAGAVAKKAKRVAEKTFKPKESKKVEEYASKLGISLGHGGIKLARLIKESNEYGFQKEASETLHKEIPASYEKLASLVAASADWDIGMMDAAIDYVGELENSGVDDDSIEKVAQYLFDYSLVTDATIHAIMEKRAGNTAKLETLRNNFIKEAIFGLMGRAASRIGGGIGKMWSRGAGKIQGWRTGWSRGTSLAHKAEAAKAGKEIAAIQKTMKTAPLDKQIELGRYLKHKQAYQAKRLSKAKHYEAKAKRIEEKAGVRPPPMQPPQPKPTPAPAPKPTPAPAPQPTTAHPTGGATTVPPKSKPEPKAIEEGKGAGKGAGKSKGGPEQPSNINKEKLAKEDPGLFSKWENQGWNALSDIEKRRVYKYAAGAFVAQRAVMDKPIV